MITVILGIGFTAVSIAAIREVNKLKRQLKSVKLHRRMEKEGMDIRLQLEEQEKEFYFNTITDIGNGTFYHPETDTLIPFEDLEYIGEF